MRWLALLVAALLTLVPSIARAQIPPHCDGKQPDPYDEQVQQDFLQNYPALALTFSPIHGPAPHESGTGALGVDIVLIPPLSCEKQFVLQAEKVEDTNVTPIAPKIHASFAFPGMPEGTSLYAGAAYVPPVPIFDQQTVLVSGELGVGGAWLKRLPKLQLGGRFHATWSKLVANIALSFDRDRGAPEYDDLYIASSFGFDALAGWELLPWLTPYVAVGFTDVSTFFYIGDDGVVTNNMHPYASFVFSIGLDALAWEHFRWGVEFYGAPGGYSTVDPDLEASRSPAAYGHLYTARARLAYEF